jgi:hypothetical protein
VPAIYLPARTRANSQIGSAGGGVGFPVSRARNVEWAVERPENYGLRVFVI